MEPLWTGAGAIAIAAAYLVGSIPFGWIAGQIKGVDVRAQGSKNIGATNVARTIGKKVGAIVLLLDVGKGAIPVLLALHLAAAAQLGEFGVTAVGVAAIVGHCFPVWLRFRGGKGVATSLGVFLAVDPAVAGMAIGLFVVVYLVARVVSIGSLLAATYIPIAMYVFDRPRAWVWLAAISAAIIVVKHHGNIRRLLSRSELKV